MTRPKAALGSLGLLAASVAYAWLFENYPVTTMTCTALVSGYVTLRGDGAVRAASTSAAGDGDAR